MPFSTDDLEPKPIDYEREGFDGPTPGNIEPFPKTPRFVPITDSSELADPRKTAQYTATIKACMDVLSARLLGLIAMVGSVGMFSYAVYDPVPWRTYTVVAEACVVLLPAIYLYLRRG